jgi:hypothetical protein
MTNHREEFKRKPQNNACWGIEQGKDIGKREYE